MSTILIADDEARIRRLVSDFLKRDGHSIVKPPTGAKRCKYWKTGTPVWILPFWT